MTKQWTQEEMLARLCALAAEQVEMDASAVMPESDFYSDLSFDSLDRVEFMMRVEEEFDVNVDDEQAEGVQTPRAAMELLVGAMQGKG